MCAGCKETILDSRDSNPSPELTPEQELETFVIEPGLKIQLVASEPMVQDPVVMTFDEDGRLWVVEMRGFMPDIDGKGEKDRIGRVSILNDVNNDGVMDSATIYMDSLILPRAIAIVAQGALIVENAALWLTQDLNGDDRADTKILLDSMYAGSMLPEHSGNGLLRGLDNWYYNVKSKLKYSLNAGRWVKDTTEFRGQWGLSQDDEGRLYYNYNWSQLHADLVPPNYLSRNKNHTATTGIDQGLTLDRRVYPIRANPAVNRGYIPGTLDGQGRLLEFTAACSPFFYRSRTLPTQYYGNVFVCEPSGNLIKRNVTHEAGISLTATDPHPGKEFLASTDERFRPVHLTTGPDGALYIVDMYRGLIQHGAYVTPYLREQTIKRNLVLPVHRGRIWRVVSDDYQQLNLEKLSKITASELIPYLAHSNGWYRDMAQKLLIEKNAKTSAPQIMELAQHSKIPLGRLHALWTLEGLGMLTADFLFNQLMDSNAIIRAHIVRLLEPFANKENLVRARLGLELNKRWSHAEEKELLQYILTAGFIDKKSALALLSDIILIRDTSAIMRDAVLSSLYGREYDFLRTLWNTSWRENATPSKEIFLEMLTTAILRHRNSNELAGLFSLLPVDRPLHWVTKTILNGIVIQGYDQKFKPIPLTAKPKIFQADVAFDTTRLKIMNNMFEWPGHKVQKSDLVNNSLYAATDQKQYALGRQQYLSTCAGCHGTDGTGVPRYAPTLIGSEWVLGNEKRLALLILHGIEGPIEVNGKMYDAPEILPVMPAHSPLDDSKITAIINYIRNEWGNAAAPISNRIVGGTRHSTQGRVMPWTAIELNKHISDTLPK